MRIMPDETRCIVIDMQEKLVPVMAEKERLMKKITMLLQGLKELGIPMILTTQYAKGLGMTVPEITEAMGSEAYIDKRTFSACGQPQVMEYLEQDKTRKTIIVVGIETHICVIQTIMDLAAAGYRPVLVEDCVSSRDLNDKKTGVQRAMQEGAVVTTAEAVLFELTQEAGNPHFKQISALVK